MTAAGIEPATFRFVAQRLNHCGTAVQIRLSTFDNTERELSQLSPTYLETFVISQIRVTVRSYNGQKVPFDIAFKRNTPSSSSM